jgi:outer membrane lipoprotein SlyB
MNRRFSTYVSLLVSMFVLAGCATNEFSGNRYEGAAVGEVSRTDRGYVLSLRKVEIKPEGSTTGAALGAVGGGLLGSLFGGGDGKYLTTAAGAVAGGVAGNAIASRPVDGIEYTVKLDNGSIITITQGVSPAISVGQRVYVINSNKGRSRIVAE